MTALAEYLQAFAATARRDTHVYLSYRLRIFSQAFGMLFTLTIFYYVSKLVRVGAVGPHSSYFVFVVVGIVTMSIINASLTLSNLVRNELLAGNFERLVISPLGPVAGAISLATFPVCFAIVFAGLMLALADAVFGVPVRLAGIPLAALVVVIAGVAFTAIGLVFVGGLIAYKSAMGALWVISGLSLLGGVYFPVALFPSWIRWTSDVQPLTPTIDLLRHSLVGTVTIEPVWLELLKLAGFAAVLMPIGAAVLWQAIRLSRRRGTLMEY